MRKAAKIVGGQKSSRTMKARQQNVPQPVSGNSYGNQALVLPTDSSFAKLSDAL
jgi:hypothetical protein